MDYNLYHPNWKRISQIVRTELAENKCQFCLVHNHSTGYWVGREFVTIEHWGDYLTDTGFDLYWNIPISKRLVTIELTVAHLDQDRDNNDISNLAALCQRCHFAWDLAHNLRKRWERTHKGQMNFFNNHII